MSTPLHADRVHVERRSVAPHLPLAGPGPSALGLGDTVGLRADLLISLLPSAAGVLAGALLARWALPSP